MRLSPPITILAIVVAAMGWLIIDRAWTEHNNLEACSVAEAFADFTQVEADVFGGPPLTMPLTATAVDQLQQRLPDTPEYRIASELLSRSVMEKPIDPLAACPNLATRLDKFGIAHGQAAVDSALSYKAAKAKSPNRPIYVLAMRLPLVSANGKFAIVEMTYSSAVYKSGDILLVRKGINGHWAEVTKLRMWVS